MHANEIKIDLKYKPILERIDNYRKTVGSIIIDAIFEPNQALLFEKEKSKVLINCPEDLLAWQKEVGYSFITKAYLVEDEIIKLVADENFYISAILLRHHMELCGLITLSLEKLIESLNKNSLDFIEDFIAKISFGSHFQNNKKFKYIPEAFASTKTPNVVSFINALDRFIEVNVKGPNNKNIFSKNYSALNHFAHPSSLSSGFFNDAVQVENGYEIHFHFAQDAGGDLAKYNILRLLEQNIIVGYTAYYIFNSYKINADFSIEQDENQIRFAYNNFIGIFQQATEEFAQLTPDE